MIDSNKNYYMSCLFFLFFFIGWGCCYPYLSLWLTETIGINYGDVGLVYSFTAIVAVYPTVVWFYFRQINLPQKPDVDAGHYHHVVRALLDLYLRPVAENKCGAWRAGGQYLYRDGLWRRLRGLRSVHR